MGDGTPNGGEVDLAVVLAGGQGRRFGGTDKGALQLGHHRLGALVCARIAKQARQVIVVGHNTPNWCPDHVQFVADICDAQGQEMGPVGGVLAGLTFACETLGQAARVVTVPVDSPFFPDDVVGQFARAKAKLAVESGGGEGAGVIALHAGRTYPVFGLWDAGVAVERIHHGVFAGNMRALHKIAAHCGASAVPIDGQADAFFNINTPEDLARAEDLFGQGRVPGMA